MKTVYFQRYLKLDIFIQLDAVYSSYAVLLKVQFQKSRREVDLARLSIRIIARIAKELFGCLKPLNFENLNF